MQYYAANFEKGTIVHKKPIVNAYFLARKE